MIKVILDILAQIILSSLSLLKNASKLSQSHTIVRSLGDTGSRSKSAIHLSIDPRSHAMSLYMYTNSKTKKKY